MSPRCAHPGWPWHCFTSPEDCSCLMPSNVIHRCLFTCRNFSSHPQTVAGQTNYFCPASHKEQLDPEPLMYPRVCRRLHGLVTEEQDWLHGSWMNAANERLQLEQAILAQGLRAKRKSTTAVAKEVVCLLNSRCDSCSSQHDPLRCTEWVGRGHNNGSHYTFPCCSFTRPFHVIKIHSGLLL